MYALIAALALSCCDCGCDAPETVDSREVVSEHVWESWYMAEFNKRYHTQMAADYKASRWTCTIAWWACAAFGIALIIIGMFDKMPWQLIVMGFCFIIIPVVPFACLDRTIGVYSGLADRWRSVAYELKAIQVEMDSMPEKTADYFLEQSKEVTEKMLVLENEEPVPPGDDADEKRAIEVQKKLNFSITGKEDLIQ